MINKHKLTFDVAFTSVLKRAIKTLYMIQDGCDLHWIPVHRHWRLNERMYGALQGLNKSETAAKHGEEQVKVMLPSGIRPEKIPVSGFRPSRKTSIPEIFIGPSKILLQFIVCFQSFTEKKNCSHLVCYAVLSLL